MTRRLALAALAALAVSPANSREIGRYLGWRTHSPIILRDEACQRRVTGEGDGRRYWMNGVMIAEYLMPVCWTSLAGERTVLVCPLPSVGRTESGCVRIPLAELD